MNTTLELWLMRHAAAEESLAKGDDERQLSEEGHRQARRQGAAIHARGLHFGLIASSPLRRCLQTVEHVSHEIGYRGEVVEDDRLRFDAAVDDMIAFVLEQKSRLPQLAHLLLVGHAPSIGHLKARLMHDADQMSFEKLAAYGFRLELDDEGSIARATLLGELPPPAH